MKDNSQTASIEHVSYLIDQLEKGHLFVGQQSSLDTLIRLKERLDVLLEDNRLHMPAYQH